MQGFANFMQHNWGWILSFVTVLLGGGAYVVTQITSIKRGLQALLRAQMIDDYNHYSEKGWAPIYARQNFENCWVNYERLFKNGVLHDIHDRFMALPTEEPDHNGN